MLDNLKRLEALIWGLPGVLLIVSVGVYLTIKTGFAQFRLFPEAIKHLTKQIGGKEEGRSGYRSFCTALGATVGTGNLAGVAGAIALGGPGAVFWMWICALFGMIIKYAEAVLAVRFREKNGDGELVGGPMYVMKNGLQGRGRYLAGVYCFLGVIAALGVGNGTQINTIVGSINSVSAAFGGMESRLGDFIMGVILALAIGAVLLGGADIIGKIAEAVVPVAAGVYLVLCLGVLTARASAIPEVLSKIVKGAFDPTAVTGGVLGSAFIAARIGASRGVFTNEAGMGTAGIAHGAAAVKHPSQQGLMGIMEVFLDTIVICTMTALVILCSGVSVRYGTDEGIVLTNRAFSAIYGNWIRIPLAIIVCFLGIATVLGWGLYGGRCAQYLFGDAAWKKFCYLQVIMVVVGAVLRTDTVWVMAGIINGCMMLPNLLSVGLLSGEVEKLTRTYKKAAPNIRGSREITDTE